MNGSNDGDLVRGGYFHNHPGSKIVRQTRRRYTNMAEKVGATLVLLPCLPRILSLNHGSITMLYGLFG